MRTSGGLAVSRPRPAATDIGFVDAVAAGGARLALVDECGRPVSYGALDARIADAADRLGDGRRLVALPLANTLDAITWYLACLRGGHVALITPGEARLAEPLLERFAPDVTVCPDTDRVEEQRPGSTHELHPDLAVLLSTSGSTGAPKLVRLSRLNLDTNARAIASALELTEDDRAITSLPLSYCYGLSVLHSHLAVGGSLVLTSASVVDPCFWEAVDRHGVTTIAGVPHTFELLDRRRHELSRHPSVRLVTQAGGRLRPDLVQSFAEQAARHDIDFRVMYGQTEATARIAVMPRGLAARRPDAVGRAVPGTTVRIDANTAGGSTTTGELVVEGPGVMMGYATEPAHLSWPPQHRELRTGDLAHIDDRGIIEIVGRSSEFVKPFGLRIDLRRVQSMLRDDGIACEVLGDDDGLAIATSDDADADATRADVAARLSLPVGAVAVAPLPTLPRLENGKLDRMAALAAVRSLDAAARAGAEHHHGNGDTGSDTDVASLFATVLGVDVPGPDDSFVSLGGDSLSYVEMSVRLEAVLGHLPDDWHHAPIASLQASTRGRTAWGRVETNVVLRAIAIVLVIANHTGAFLIGGGAHVLLAGAGFNLARFQLANGPPWRSIGRLALPAVVWIGGVAALREDFDLAHAVLLHGWIGGPGRWAYWFVEVLVQLLVGVALLLSIPRLRRWERARPFAFAAALTAAASLVRFDIIDLGEHHRPFFRPHEVAWIFLLGWLAQRADTPQRRLAVSGAILVCVPGYFGNATRELVLAAGMLALLWIRRIALPRWTVPAAATLAGASLWIYLTHYQIHPLLSPQQPLLAMAASVLFGVVAWRAVDPLLARTLDRALLRARARLDRFREQPSATRDTVDA